MSQCPTCQKEYRKGTLICENCGANLLIGGRDDGGVTTKIQPIEKSKGGRSGWGPSIFKKNQVVIHIESVSEPITLTVTSRILLGRYDSVSDYTPDLDLTPYQAGSKGVSRLHASIQRTGDRLELVDLDSANGTYINGKQLRARTPGILRDGDEIRLGNLVLHIFFS